MKNEGKRLFAETLASYDLPLSSGAFSLLCEYYALLAKANEHTNLTAVIAPEEAALRHFVDSLRPDVYSSFLPGQLVADIGTGAGFPGLPLAISNPECRFFLVDSLEKRVRFLQETIAALGLTNCTVVRARAEIFGRGEYREKMDHALSRAVAPLSALQEYMLPCLKMGGFAWAWKGPTAKQEVTEARISTKTLGGGRIQTLPYSLGNVTFFVVKTEKIKPTPLKFPRKEGIPSKQPL